MELEKAEGRVKSKLLCDLKMYLCPSMAFNIATPTPDKQETPFLAPFPHPAGTSHHSFEEYICKSHQANKKLTGNKPADLIDKKCRSSSKSNPAGSHWTGREVVEPLSAKPRAVPVHPGWAL